MELKRTPNKKLFEMVFENHDEYIQLSSMFIFKKRQAKFKKVAGYGEVVDFVKKNRFIPVQLWQYAYSICSKNGFSFKYDDIKSVILETIDEEKVKEIYIKVVSTDKNISYDEDQFQSILGMLKHNYVKQDLSVAYGKTLVFFVVVAYLMLHKNDKVIITLPKPSLATQVYAEFMSFCRVYPELLPKIGATLGGGDMSTYSQYDCLITNFQYAWTKEDEYFEKFTVSIIDEVHRASSKSYKIILDKCVNLRSTKGASGSIVSDGSFEAMAVVASSGFTFKVVQKREIINSGRATDGKVIVAKVESLGHNSLLALQGFYEVEEDHLERLNKELELIRKSSVRIDAITGLVEEFSAMGNGLVFFKDVKNQYGRRLADATAYKHRHLKVFYIDQHVKQKLRDEVYEFMRNNTGCVLFVSYDIASTGLNVKNLVWGLLGEPIKSDVILGQVIGRFMRKHDDKNQFFLIDILDEIEKKYCGGVESYMSKWYWWSRKTEYDKDRFPIEMRKIQTNKGLNW